MGDVSAESVTLELLREARETVRGSPLGVVQTPIIPWGHTSLPPVSVPCNIHIKLENMQTTGRPINCATHVVSMHMHMHIHLIYTSSILKHFSLNTSATICNDKYYWLFLMK